MILAVLAAVNRVCAHLVSKLGHHRHRFGIGTRIGFGIDERTLSSRCRSAAARFRRDAGDRRSKCLGTFTLPATVGGIGKSTTPSRFTCRSRVSTVGAVGSAAQLLHHGPAAVPLSGNVDDVATLSPANASMASALRSDRRSRAASDSTAEMRARSRKYSSASPASHRARSHSAVIRALFAAIDRARPTTSDRIGNWANDCSSRPRRAHVRLSRRG